MKSSFFKKFFVAIIFIVAVLATVTVAASLGTIDPSGTGQYKAAFLDNTVVTNTAINFGKFTTESQYNITVSDTELRGFAWGSSVGYIVTNCANTNSGCSATNGNFKIANNAGALSGYAWGENTGWINFGPFTDSTISTVKIDSSGNFGGTTGTAGYAWSQNYGWIVFDCSNAATCVNTNWRITPPSTGGTSGGGASGGGSAPSTPSNPNTQPVTVVASNVVCDAHASLPDWGRVGVPTITSTTATTFVANSNGHCHLTAGQDFQWGDQTSQYDSSIVYGPMPTFTTFGPSDNLGVAVVNIPANQNVTTLSLREILQPKYIPFLPVQSGNPEFYCSTVGRIHQSVNYIQNPQPGAVYYCVAFNPVRPAATTKPTTPVTPTTPTTPTTPSNPSNPTQPTTPTNPPTQPTTPPSGTTTTPTSGNGSTPDQGGPTDTTGSGSDGSGSSGQSGTTTATGPTQPPTGNTTQPTGNPAQSTNEPGVFGQGLQLPPALSETLSNIVSSIGGFATAIIQPFSGMVNGISDSGSGSGSGTTTSGISTAAHTVAHAVRTPTGNKATKAATAVGLVGTVAGAFALLALANPFSLAELFLLPFRLWTLLLIAFGFKKRNHPWGTVYDSVTKQPIDPAYVMLMDMNGVEVATSITDIDGRYGFSVQPGTYKIVVTKTNFAFPSTKLAGASADELHTDLYFGDAIVVQKEGEIITKNIPMDQLNFDWNEFAKTEQKRLSYYRHSDVVIAHIASIFFWFGFAVSGISLLASHSVYNIIVFLLYVFLFIIRHYSLQFKAKGFVSEALTEQPVPFAIIHVLSAATGQEVTHKVADRLGNYYCLVPNGTYTIVIDRKNADASYTKIAVAQPVTVTQGYLKQNFTI